jgi:hypothetical protein
MRVLLLSIFLAANLAAQGALEVVAAYWGVTDRYVDVTSQVKSQTQLNGLNFTVATSTFGFDPVPGQVKTLRIYYRLNGQLTNGEWRDGMTVQVAATGSANANITQRNPIPLRVTKALYGKGGLVRDVTAVIQSRVVNNTLAIPVNNDFMGGDPAIQQVKDFVMTYEWQGVAYEMFAKEGDTVNLPDGSVIAAAPAQGVLRIVSARYGRGNRVADVTALLQSRVNEGRLSVTANNSSMGGDPGKGDNKQLVVIYEINGQRSERRVNEDQVLSIP